MKHTKIYKQSGKMKRDREGEGELTSYWPRRKIKEHRRRQILDRSSRR
jgi:hypothetical protein